MTNNKQEPLYKPIWDEEEMKEWGKKKEEPAKSVSNEDLDKAMEPINRLLLGL